ncbi:hypothetical protein BST91_04550 [Nonlabens tegetincola]|uniref:DUF1853 family protein n=1 Tax=Nonlabens tegetincola TaxID=323273 RepID=UPI000A2045DB|nr:DUF1853 family protein [Nonlabens tegetincola]ARN70969.1 hypothetical protein BST91_04550 [Nonlabens tegetincola]
MNDTYKRFEAFFTTRNFWKGNLSGMEQFALDSLDFSHLKESTSKIDLPNIPPNTVLGKRAEYFFKFCVEQSKNYDVLLSNEQIFSNKETLGEIDYILQNKITGKQLHVELVYKFYIYDPCAKGKSNLLDDSRVKELSRYVGPNRRDTFLKKLHRLQQHQLPLLYRKETRKTLEKLDINVDALKQQVCFLAHVFIPQNHWNKPFPFINKACISGYYLDYNAFAKAYSSHTYFLPHKHLWKSHAHELEVSYNHSTILPIVQESLKRGYAPMLWKQVAEDSFERFFVTMPKDGIRII